MLRGESVTVPGRRKSRALLYYLAAHSCPVARSELLALLYTEAEPTAARHSLSVAIHDLKGSLGSALETSVSSLRLAPNVQVDVRKLMRAMGLGRRDIGIRFLVEATIHGAMGGTAGLLIGVLAAAAVAQLQAWLPVVPPVALTVPAMMSVLAGSGVPNRSVRVASPGLMTAI